MKLSELLSVLSREPFSLAVNPMTLTMDQIEAILRDPQEAAGKPVQLDFKAHFRRWVLENRVPEWYAEKVWRERGQ